MVKVVRIPRLLRIAEGVADNSLLHLREAGFDLGKVVVVTGGANTARVASSILERCPSGCDFRLVSHARGEIADVDCVEEAIHSLDAQTCIAVGGGKVIDTAKLASHRAVVPFVSIPTSLAHDGVSSPVASIHDRGGRRASFAATMPDAVIVDLDVIQSAPPATLRAGAGDLLSNFTALADWRLASQKRGEEYDGYSALIAEEATFAFSEVAKSAEFGSTTFLMALARGLVLSGLAMAAAGTSRPCSGAEHLISHSLDGLLAPSHLLHGEQVAIGTLVAAVAHGMDMAALANIYDRLGLPLSLSSAGLTWRVMVEAIQRAPSTRPERYTILSAYDSLAAIEELLALTFAGLGAKAGVA